MKNNLKERNKGITLVALVITIIILLILAGITINSLTGSGLFENTKLAKERYENAEKLENQTLGEYKNGIDEYINNDRASSVKMTRTLLYPATKEGKPADTTGPTYNLNDTYENYEYLLVETESSSGNNGTNTTLIPTSSIVRKDSFSQGGVHSSWAFWSGSGSIWLYFNSKSSFAIGYRDNYIEICHIYGIN